MTLSEFKTGLNTVDQLNFILPNGKTVPNHFHVTEVGQVTKHFIDCGGRVRDERVVNFQLWEAGDFDHRLAPEKLIGIIALSEKVLNVQDGEIEVEYQSDTIGKYGVDFDGKNFLLTSKHTACLASDNCGTGVKTKLTLAELQPTEKSCCAPGGGCC
ncbi:MAG: DUF6428 family protein [Bacteroidota bacterium]|nr:DUF6428 family protein [Bacteroidota bacterium]